MTPPNKPLAERLRDSARSFGERSNIGVLLTEAADSDQRLKALLRRALQNEKVRAELGRWWSDDAACAINGYQNGA